VSLPFRFALSNHNPTLYSQQLSPTKPQQKQIQHNNKNGNNSTQNSLVVNWFHIFSRTKETKNNRSR